MAPLGNGSQTPGGQSSSNPQPSSPPPQQTPTQSPSSPSATPLKLVPATSSPFVGATGTTRAPSESASKSSSFTSTSKSPPHAIGSSSFTATTFPPAETLSIITSPLPTQQNTTPEPKSDNGRLIAAIVGSVLGGFLLLVILLCVWLWKFRNRSTSKRNHSRPFGQVSGTQKVKRFLQSMSGETVVNATPRRAWRYSRSTSGSMKSSSAVYTFDTLVFSSPDPSTTDRSKGRTTRNDYESTSDGFTLNSEPQLPSLPPFVLANTDSRLNSMNTAASTYNPPFPRTLTIQTRNIHEIPEVPEPVNSYSTHGY